MALKRTKSTNYKRPVNVIEEAWIKDNMEKLSINEMARTLERSTATISKVIEHIKSNKSYVAEQEAKKKEKNKAKNKYGNKSYELLGKKRGAVVMTNAAADRAVDHHREVTGSNKELPPHVIRIRPE